MTNGERMAGPNGYIATPEGIVAGATARGTDLPTGVDANYAANMTPSKTAEEEVVGMVYNKYFGGDQ